MTTVLYVLGGLLLLFLAMSVFIEKAPYGWEDEDGYHDGKEPRK